MKYFWREFTESMLGSMKAEIVVMLFCMICSGCSFKKGKKVYQDSVVNAKSTFVLDSSIESEVRSYLKKNKYDLAIVDSCSVHPDSISSFWGLDYELSDTNYFRIVIGRNLKKNLCSKIFFKRRQIAWVSCWMMENAVNSIYIYSMFEKEDFGLHDSPQMSKDVFLKGSNILILSREDGVKMRDEAYNNLLRLLHAFSDRKVVDSIRALPLIRE